MDSARPSVKNRYLIILCCVAAALVPIVFMGCQEITDPPQAQYSDVNGDVSGIRTVSGLSMETGPFIILTNEYLDPTENPPYAGFMRIPEDVPITFCWTAREIPGGGAIKAYRYGWDVFDVENPNVWDIAFTAYDGSEVCSPSRSFNITGIHLFAVEVIDEADVSSRIIIAVQIVSGPPSFDVMPGSCKNPFSMQRKGQIRTVIPGRIGLDVSEIDVSSLHLWIDGNVVEPLETRVRDIASPMINRDPCECPPKGRDGIEDLVIFFAAADISRVMGHVLNGETREISIHGNLLNGEDFALKDCINIVGNPRTGDDPALFNRDAVLAALQKGYNEKDFKKISALFDDDFAFFFSEADVQQGYVPQAQWGREEELAATANLFTVDYPTDARNAGAAKDLFKLAGVSEEVTWGRIKSDFFEGIGDGQTSISLLLIFNAGEDNWTAVNPPDPDQYPGEVWYEKSANYFLTVWIDDVYFVTPVFLQALFVVRFSGEKEYWQLVQWRDDL